ncbi:glycosyltransferase family 2 protein [Providencia sp. PROV147]|uniref:glycosyltransferase family 2 protein n=1 Tax=Providencia sp. PROV147 TaxID=2949857 RepID=UPI00234AAE16|nr:glycosyltransferase [Providencia sp. PROV147]
MQTDIPMISVILPVFNSEKYLNSAIESILLQNFINFELIIINDGSTDSSYNIIKHWASRDKRIITVNRENKGLVYSLNEAIDLSKGQFIARMDADDIALPDRLQEQFNYLTINNLDICGCHYFEINEYDELAGLRLVPTTQNMITISLSSSVPFAHPSVLIRKEFLSKNNLKYGEGIANYAEDLDLWIRMFNAGAKFGNVNKILFKYRLLSNSLSRIRRKKILNDSANLFASYFKINKALILKELENIHHPLNKYELEWVGAIYMRQLLRLQGFKFLSNLKKLPKKTVVNVFFSELNKIIKL